MTPLAELAARTAQAGSIEAILVRPERRIAPLSRAHAVIGAQGVEGDHGRPGKRAVTLVQAEHLAAIASFLGLATPVDPVVLRRNLVVRGVNLSALRGRQVRLGDAAVVEITGPCAPCSRMEDALGHGGYAAMRGHGGWCAQVCAPGAISVGAAVTVLPLAEGD